MKKTQNDQTKAITKYNDEAAEAYFRSLMGDDMWARFKPSRNINDFIYSTANDNGASA